jgi:asparagine synthase (glutamine-hydrolysing)
VTRHGKLQVRRYWTLPPEDASPPADPVAEYAQLFNDAVALRLRSDVPVGVALSGGMDSTSIICSMAKIREQTGGASTLHAFSYLPSEFDESKYVHQTIATTGARLHQIAISPSGFWAGLDRLLDCHDEPVHSATAFVGYEIYRAAAEEGVKVLLSGQGADETLGGYKSYFTNWWLSLLRDGHFGSALKEIQAYARGHNASLISESLAVGVRCALLAAGRTRWYRSAVAGRRLAAAYPYGRLLTQDLRAALPAPDPAGVQTLGSALAFSTEGSPLPLYLRIEDRNSMAHSVEARLPFLDYRLVSLAFRLAGHWKIRGEWNKFLLRQATAGLIPEEVRGRVEKLGFPTSIDGWLRNDLHTQVGEVLASREFTERGIFEPAAVEMLLKLHHEGGRNFGSVIFNLVQTELWLRILGRRSARAFSGS